MQNVKMNFVAFDAQDVIATSGWENKHIVGTAGLFAQYNKANPEGEILFANKSGSAFKDVGNNFYVLYKYDAVSNGGKLSTRTSGIAANKMEDLYTGNSVLEADTKMATDLVDIATWLHDNNIH